MCRRPEGCRVPGHCSVQDHRGIDVGFYDWCQRETAEPTDREIAEAELVALIREIFDATEGNDGVPRMHRELRDGGIVVNVKQVRRLMRLHGMAGRCIRRRVRTTIPGPDGYLVRHFPTSCYRPTICRAHVLTRCLKFQPS